jgi:hypothetical protein
MTVPEPPQPSGWEAWCAAARALARAPLPDLDDKKDQRDDDRRH